MIENIFAIFTTLPFEESRWYKSIGTVFLIFTALLFEERGWYKFIFFLPFPKPRIRYFLFDERG